MNQNILGDKRKSNFDDNLADVVNKIFDNLPENSDNVSSERKLFLEPRCVLDGKLTQNQWFSYWAAVPQRYMASMADFYQAFKQLKHQYENGNEQEKLIAQRFREDLLKDMYSEIGNPNVLISSTRIIYELDSLKGTIIHHYDCKELQTPYDDPKRKEIVKETTIDIPEYSNIPIFNLNPPGINFLKALFNTEDNLGTIAHTLEFISRVNVYSINLFTAKVDNDPASNIRTRKMDQKRFAGFVGGYDRYFMIATSYVLGDNNHGHSRGVKYE